MSTLYIEAFRRHTCHHKRGGIVVRKEDDIPQLRLRVLGVRIKCERYYKNCPPECPLDQLISKTESANAIEPVVVVGLWNAKVLKTGVLVKRRIVFPYEE